MKAYVLITTRAGMEEKAAATIKKVKGVTSADSVYGHYDVIVIAESSEMKTLNGIVHEIQKQEGVLHTETAFSQHMEDLSGRE
jgi:DNA-binding Lrp family transcriptional regulator